MILSLISFEILSSSSSAQEQVQSMSDSRAEMSNRTPLKNLIIKKMGVMPKPIYATEMAPSHDAKVHRAELGVIPPVKTVQIHNAPKPEVGAIELQQGAGLQKRRAVHLPPNAAQKIAAPRGILGRGKGSRSLTKSPATAQGPALVRKGEAGTYVKPHSRMNQLLGKVR